MGSKPPHPNPLPFGEREHTEFVAPSFESHNKLRSYRVAGTGPLDAAAAGGGGSILPSSGFTFCPGRARCSPSITIRSVGARPGRMTPRPAALGPSSPRLVPAPPAAAPVNTILRD